VQFIRPQALHRGNHELRNNQIRTTGPAHILTLQEYAAALRDLGTKIVSGSGGAFWMENEHLSLIRMPTFDTQPLTEKEVNRVLRVGRTGIISYLLEPSDRQIQNAFLYICKNQNYRLENLPPSCRRNVRRGLSGLEIAHLTSDELLRHGWSAYADTRQRIGLSDGTPEQFHRRFGLRSKCSGHVFWGAWKGDVLAGFLSIVRVDRWAEVEGCFSMDAYLNLRPNDVLLYSVLSNYLCNEACEVVSYGVSSVQNMPNESGLHAFKTKVGFEAKPVHRVFLPHPFIRPFVGRVGRWGLRRLLRFSPRNRRLLKAQGMISHMLDS